jgi:hypothetical protein
VADVVGVALIVLAGFLGAAHVASANELVTITIPARQGEIPSGWLPYAGPPRADVLLPDGYDPIRAIGEVALNQRGGIGSHDRHQPGLRDHDGNPREDPHRRALAARPRATSVDARRAF